jgi:hypothetical protein
LEEREIQRGKYINNFKNGSTASQYTAYSGQARTNLLFGNHVCSFHPVKASVTDKFQAAFF